MSIEGRSKDMIIRGGENIQPTEIENFFVTHPKIHQCYVIGVPSARLGEEVAAYIKVRFYHAFHVEKILFYVKILNENVLPIPISQIEYRNRTDGEVSL